MNKLIPVGSVALLAACASVPQHSQQLDQARTEVETLSQDPLAQQAAGRDLESARRSLQQAEAAQQQRQPPAIVDHLAYLAQRHAEAGEARTAAARAHQQVAQAQAERDKILMNAQARATQNAQIEAENARGQAAVAQSQLADARQQLADMQAKQTQRGMVVTLGDVLFDTGQATLKPGADLQLNRLAQYLRENPRTKIIVEGHTDSRGSDDYNQLLSQRRAQSVADALESRGVPANQIEATGRGKAYPVASNDTQAGRQQNRRVEVIFSDDSGRFAEGSRSPAALR